MNPMIIVNFFTFVHELLDSPLYLCKGLREGFVTFIPNTVLPNIEFINLLSARRNAQDFQELIDKEIMQRLFAWSFWFPSFLDL